MNIIKPSMEKSTMKLLTAILSIFFVMFVQNANAASMEASSATITLSNALVCEQLCVSLDAEEKAAEIKQASMFMLSAEQIAKAHALANEEIQLYTQLLNSPMANVRIAGVQSIQTVQENILTY